MIHNFFLSGVLKKITVSTPRDPSKSPSAVLLVQYGDTRESTGRQVEFINAVLIRVPSYQYPRVADKLREGTTVTVHGHLQGVYKAVMDEGHFTAELVADRIYFEGGRSAAPAAAEAAPVAAAGGDEQAAG